jgi:DNA polymerase-3 subunit epsilon
MKELAKRLDKDLVVYDIESTGLDLNADQVIQFHATRISKDGKFKELTFVCKPTCPIHPKAAEVNGFTEEKLKGKRKFSGYVKDIIEFFKDADVAGYNINKFDNVILNRQMEENGVKDFLKDRLSFDAYEVYSHHINKKLAGALSFYCGEQEAKGAHDAKNDVGFTIQIINAQLKKEDASPQKVVGLISEKQKERQANDLSKYLIKNDKQEWVFNFSKNKGTRLCDCEQGFLNWILSKEFPDSLKAIVKQFIK